MVVALYAIPPFYLAYLLITWFAIDHAWFPTAGMVSPGLDAHGSAYLADRARHLVLPVCVLGMAARPRASRGSPAGVWWTRSRTTTRAPRARRGSPRDGWSGVTRFATRCPPLLTVAGLSAPFLLGGAVVIESVFAWPGMGSLMVDSIGSRDYPIVLAVNFIAACLRHRRQLSGGRGERVGGSARRPSASSTRCER